MTSMEINAAVGERVLEAFPETKVDVHNPDLFVNVEIRENNSLVYFNKYRGAGGYPV